MQLGELGYELHLEHGGAHCPGALRDVRDFVILHDHGIVQLSIVFCCCKEAAPETMQLMCVSLWPATWEKPNSAITLQALKIFDSLTVNAHTTAHDFMRHLERLSNVVVPDEVKVSLHVLRSDTILIVSFDRITCESFELQYTPTTLYAPANAPALSQAQTSPLPHSLSAVLCAPSQDTTCGQAGRVTTRNMHKC